MTFPEPFTYSNVITATMDILNAYPEDELARNAKRSLGRLRQRLGYAAPECHGERFWASSTNYSGYFDICRDFNDSHKRSKRIFSLYTRVLQKYQKEGFHSLTSQSKK